MIKLTRPHFTLYLCRLAELAMTADVRPTRVGLALVAALWSLGLALPGDTLERPVYEHMRFLPEWAWVIIWAIVAISMMWSSLDARPLRRRILITDLFAVLTFSGVASAILAARVWPFPAAVSADIVCSLCSLWVFARTWGERRDA